MSIVNYFTDASITNGDGCSACIKYVGDNKYDLVKTVTVNNCTNINKCELVAIKLALADILNNYEASNIYKIYTDSDYALNAIRNNTRRYSEVVEINHLLSIIPVGIDLLKSHTSGKYQQKYFQANNRHISLEEANMLCRGNNTVDLIARNFTYINNIPLYNSTPFDFEIPKNNCPWTFIY